MSTPVHWSPDLVRGILGLQSLGMTPAPTHVEYYEYTCDVQLILRRRVQRSCFAHADAAGLDRTKGNELVRRRMDHSLVACAARDAHSAEAVHVPHGVCSGLTIGCLEEAWQ
jgi:tyrosine-protein phosphatase YwqE